MNFIKITDNIPYNGEHFPYKKMGKENPNLNKYVYFKWELNCSINTDNEMVYW